MGDARKGSVSITIFGVGAIPDPAEDAPREQVFEYAALVATLIAGNSTTAAPTKRLARLYMDRWHPEEAPRG